MAGLLEAAMAETDDYFAVRYDGRCEWLVGRAFNPRTGRQTLGASDAGVVEGVSRFKTAQELYDERRGWRTAADLSLNPNVARGVASEPLLRNLFRVEHPDYEVADGTNVVFYSKRWPWASASLDSILRYGGMLGVHEIKSVTWSSKWRGEFLPDDYFLQVVHQLMVTGWGFATLQARVIGNSLTTERLYSYSREQVLEQGQALMEDELKFITAVERGDGLSCYKIPIGI